jgi:probable HAF family extracellular repeat protein
MKRMHVMLAALATVLAWSGLDAQPTYRVVRIPGLGGRDTRARAINDRGIVVGTATLPNELPDETETRGFFFDGSTTTQLSGLTLAAASAANGLNENDDIVGQSIDLENLTTAPVLWRSGEIIDLSADQRWDGGTALAINDAGVVVGMAAAGTPFSKGFIWDAESGGQIVGTLEGRNGGANRSINDAGVVVGDSFFFGDPGLAHRVILGKEGYETRAIGAPPPASGVAWAINDDGLIVGMAAPSFAPYTAVIFTPDAEEPLIHLGTLPGTKNSVAFGVNDAGDIVGASGDHPDWVSSHAFAVFDRIMYDLNDLIVDAGGEWAVLIEATDINNRGEIVGWGETLDGQICAFLLQPASKPPVFTRGDSNADGSTDISDAVVILGDLFLGAPMNDCQDAADVNDDGKVDISDPVRLLGHLFLGSDRPPDPFGTCDRDPTIDELECESFSKCQ